MKNCFPSRRPRVACLLLLASLAVTAGCARSRGGGCVADEPWSRVVRPTHLRPTVTAASERDEIYGLAAMTVVFRDWQSDTGASSRGYNIGSVLVAPDGQIVAWGRNCNRRTGNGTQHGEVRLIQGYLAERRSYYLEHHVVYTSLEPCAQCAGMMVLAKVGRVVYAQTDPDYGKAMERLGLDSRALPDSRGYRPYPRAAASEHGHFAAAQELDAAMAAESARPDRRALVEWLASSEAREIYRRAAERLANMATIFEENVAVLAHAREFVASVPDHYVRRFPWDPPTAEALPVPASR